MNLQTIMIGAAIWAAGTMLLVAVESKFLRHDKEALNQLPYFWRKHWDHLLAAAIYLWPVVVWFLLHYLAGHYILRLIEITIDYLDQRKLNKGVKRV